jgi:hypothetical protein
MTKNELIEKIVQDKCYRKNGTPITAPCNVKNCTQSCWPFCVSQCDVARTKFDFMASLGLGISDENGNFISLKDLK